MVSMQIYIIHNLVILLNKGQISPFFDTYLTHFKFITIHSFDWKKACVRIIFAWLKREVYNEKTIKKLSAELDDNNKLVDNVGLKLSENNIPLNELGSLKMELNKAISENQRINDKIDEELDKNEKETVKRFIAGNIIGLIIFIMCLINKPLAVLFLLINARILGKNLFDVDYKSLQKMKTQEYEQKIKITRLKKKLKQKLFIAKK